MWTALKKPYSKNIDERKLFKVGDVFFSLRLEAGPQRTMVMQQGSARFLHTRISEKANEETRTKKKHAESRKNTKQDKKGNNKKEKQTKIRKQK